MRKIPLNAEARAAIAELRAREAPVLARLRAVNDELREVRRRGDALVLALDTMRAVAGEAVRAAHPEIGERDFSTHDDDTAFEVHDDGERVAVNPPAWAGELLEQLRQEEAGS